MTRILWLFLLVLLTGCVGTDLPVARLESGQRYDGDAIAFLKEAETKRAEVIENLGVPTDEFKEAGVMVYTWTTVRPYGGLYLIRKDPSPVTISEPKESHKTWALFIAYDSLETVIAKAIRSFPQSRDVKTEALDWAKLKKK